MVALAIPAKTCTLIIPVFNEAATLPAVLTSLTNHLGDSVDILVVDDGSADETGQMARAVAGVRVVRHRHNFGYGAALKTGVELATTPLVCFFDGDGQHQPEDVARLLACMDRAEMAIGSRGIQGFNQWQRAPGKLLLHGLANFLVDKPIHDLNSGLRMVRREVLQRYLHLLPNGFSASTTMTMIFLSRGYEISWLPIQINHRRGGKSQVRMLRDGARTILQMLRMVILFNPMKFFGMFSLFFFTLGVVYGSYKLLTVGLGLGLSPGALLLILVGITGFIVGLISDQISAMRLERMEQQSARLRLQEDTGEKTAD